MYDIIIIGSGPAGYTAALYASRARLKVVLIEGNRPGGQLMLTGEVENFPGYAEGVSGQEMMDDLRKQAKRFGAELVGRNVTQADFSRMPFKVKAGDTQYEGMAVIICTGASAKWLGLESEKKLQGKGVSACATCDAPFFKDKDVLVVGGGDAAMEESLHLTKFARKVYIVHRRDEFRASKIMQERILKEKKIEVLWNTELKEILDVSKGKVTGAVIVNNKTNKEKTLNVQGVFISIGHSPNSDLFKGKIELDKKGYIVLKHVTDENGVVRYSTMTSVDGVFAAGDVHDYLYRQAVTAAGYGCMAALDAELWIRENKKA